MIAIVVSRTDPPVGGYGREVSLNPFDLLAILFLWTVPVLVGYLVIRLAVRHGVMDAHRRLPPDQDPKV